MPEKKPRRTIPRKAKIDLTEFERVVRVRPLALADHAALVALQGRCFPGMAPWSQDQFESLLAHFPEGQLCVEYEGEIVASSSSLIVAFDEYEEWHDWKVIADGGYIRNHDPEGDTLYGIEIMVDPEYRGMKLARRLYDARKQLARERNLMRILIGGRIPGYGEYADQLTAREYVEQVMDRNLYDPVLTAQLANGFRLQRLIPDYFPTDEASRGYATFLEWTNLDYVPEEARRRLAHVSLVRLCVVQYHMRRIESFEEFATQCRFFVDVASDYKSDFVVFPELFTTQLLSCIEARSPAEAARRLAEYTPQYLDLFGDLAVSFNVNIVGGSQFVMEEDKLYNTAYLFRRDGTIGKQYKLHVTPNERRWWGVTPGRRVEVFDTDRGRVAIQICYDVEFPELARIAARKGANILFVPFNTDERSGYLRVRYCAQARCVENHMFVAVAGCTGHLPFVDNADIHYAQSSIFSPSDVAFDRDGIGAECTPNIETVVIHDVDVERLRRHKRKGTVQNWQDRRVDIYRIVYQGEGDEPLEV
jgi:predicted amidohydrolase/ribosomal protein S18 acetylase RimI-like enzyme